MSRTVRLLLALGVLLVSLAVLLLLLLISETTLNIHARLSELPDWVSLAWWTLLAVGGLSSVWLVWRLLRPRAKTSATQPEPLSREQLERRIEVAREQDVDLSAVEHELRELARRRAAGEIHVAMFGEISTGKSALVRALLPGVTVDSDVRGGTTRAITRYRWQSPGGDSLLLADMPGTGEVGGQLDRVAEDEALRAHLVVYVTDGDLNREQHRALQQLLGLHKPLILALNKSDRYRADELAHLSQRLEGLLAGQENTELVTVSAASERQLVRQLPSGEEVHETRAIAPKVDDLGLALQRLVDGNQALLEQLSDSTTFVLAARQLDAALASQRREKAERLVDSYSKRAVVGALAAITPGTDLLIQGYLGTQLVRELVGVYQTGATKVDTELLLTLVQKHAAKAHTLLLAVAGNALKAFPGIGTLAGGAMHALAYGIIFRTLGKALMVSLETRGELHPRQTAKLFEEKLGENLETPARRLAALVVEQVGKSER
jgi:uncharacterized protein